MNNINSPNYKKGIRSLGSGFLMSGMFRLDEVLLASVRIAYLATKILIGDLTPLARFTGGGIEGLQIIGPEWGFLNRMQWQPDKSAYYYGCLTAQPLKNKPQIK